MDNFFYKLMNLKEVGYENYSSTKLNTSHLISKEIFNAQSDNKIILGDNIEFMNALLDNYKQKFKLIYIDPPFNSKSSYYRKIKISNEDLYKLSYRDYYDNGVYSYLEMIYPRLLFIKELLRDDGFICVHIDWHIGHYLKILMDEIFGIENFKNEIIWCYGGRGAKSISSQLPRNHDTILLYGMGKKSNLNKVFKKEYLKKNYYKLDDDGKAFYTSPKGDYTDSSIENLKKENRVYMTSNGNVRIKYFLGQDNLGVFKEKQIGDVWTDIQDMMHISIKEKTGYPTQKPEALINRILNITTNKNDLVGDFFCGSGTVAVCAENLGRKWIIGDCNEDSIHVCKTRLMRMKCNNFNVEKIETLKESNLDKKSWLDALSLKDIELSKLCDESKISISFNENIKNLNLINGIILGEEQDKKFIVNSWCFNEKSKEKNNTFYLDLIPNKKYTSEHSPMALKIFDIIGNETILKIP